MERAAAARAVLAIAVVTVAAALTPSVAMAASFGWGDVFQSGSAGIEELTPSGALVQTLAGSTGAGYLCVDQSGDLIAPGVGLFDPAGTLVASDWSSVPSAPCVADGQGHVYVSGPTSAPNTVTQYDLQGDPLTSFTVTQSTGFAPLSIDLAPDGCTLYYAKSVGEVIGRLNVCTGLEDTPFGSVELADDLHVLPNLDVLVTADSGDELLDPAGTQTTVYRPTTPTIGLRYAALDPDGTSFFVSDYTGPVDRFDLASGAQLASWTGTGGPIAVYGPPLVGDANVENVVDNDAPGTAEAFSATGGFDGPMTNLHLYVDASSTATNAVIGIYTNSGDKPGDLVTQTTIPNVTAGSWNTVTVPSRTIQAGRRYWIAVLGPKGGGTLAFRDEDGGRSYTSSQHRLTSLPSVWSSGQHWSSTSLSAFGD